MFKSSQHTRTGNAPSARESTWSDTFGRNAATTNNSNFCQTSFGTPTVTPGTNSPTPNSISNKSQYLLPDTSTSTPVTPTSSDGGSVLNCPHCDRTFISRIGLVGHLRFHRTKTEEPVPGATTNNRDIRILCPRAFMNRMGQFIYMRIHDSASRRLGPPFRGAYGEHRRTTTVKRTSGESKWRQAGGT
ncbi:unnamed protein product [Schistocephalus solidus]|uniref:C2H2-type domain-containing protein n=1 Tax=Schistocephalus solidus TaxID=70667 RepID=A0A183SYV5_SCHSO|nr:unnamed protein product [Schistocephalus solidus]